MSLASSHLEGVRDWGSTNPALTRDRIRGGSDLGIGPGSGKGIDMAERLSSKTPAQTFALVFGAVYLLVGVLGFIVTGFDNFAGETFDDKLIIFSVNPLHNIVHLAIGAAWLASAGKHATAKSMNLIIGVAYGLTFLLGVLGVLKFLAIDEGVVPDDLLHLASSALAIYFGTAGAEGSRTAPA